jgi:hypothetical protein
MANAAVCPKCHEVVDRELTGKPAGFDERTDNLIFVRHDRDDERGGTIFRTRCPGSGRNLWTAANAF